MYGPNPTISDSNRLSLRSQVPTDGTHRLSVLSHINT